MRLLPSAALVIALFAGTVAPPRAVAQLRAVKEPAAKPGRLALSTDRVIAFKDGYSLVVKHATGTADERGQVWTEQVPEAAVMGCFWAMSDGGDALAMRAEWVEDKRLESKELPCLSMVDLLRANAGRKATLRLSPEVRDAREVSGTIVEVLETPADIEGVALRAEIEGAAAAPAAAPAAPPGRTVRPIAPSGGVFVVIEQADAARLVLPIDQVRELTGPDVKTRGTRREQVTERTKRLSFSGAPGKAVSLSLYYSRLGEEKFRSWLRGLKANGVRLYDGNSTVVRAAAQGEIDAGLTDTDDVYAGQHEGWPVALRTEPRPLLLPNTVGRVKGGPHGAEAAALIDFLLSERVDRVLAESEARMTPLRAAIASEQKSPQYGGLAGPDFDAIEAAVPPALAIWDEVFGR